VGELSRVRITISKTVKIMFHKMKHEKMLTTPFLTGMRKFDFVKENK